jgi:CBS domain-containing protein
MSSCIITELRPIDLSLAESKPALIAVSPTVSIQTALSLMSTNKITSLPVFSHNNTEVVSIVNLFDILLYLVGENTGSIEKGKLKLNDPVENVLGLDSDRESYRMHKTDRKDKLLEVKKSENTREKKRFY